MKPSEANIIDILKRYSFEKGVWKQYSPNMSIIGDLKINSARIVDIVLDVEDRFDIEIDDDSLESIVTVQDIVDVIEQKNKPV
ncbi:MAG TPA: phosphopantetheine-binding protein [Bacteroidales bacterium]|nr:phosphopantetheine-binding protein [Bacteroidales bacterium]